MLKRLIRAIRALFGKAISSIEDPKLILEQNIRELNDQVPRMNENIATVKANLINLTRQQKKIESDVTRLRAEIKAAIEANRDDIAENYAIQLNKMEEQLKTSREQAFITQRAYDKALTIKKVFMREREKKIQEAKEVMRSHERAKWHAKIADTLEKFEVGGIDNTHDEMIQRLKEENAKHEARMEIALESVDSQKIEIESNAERLRARDMVAKMKQEIQEKEEPKKQTESSKAKAKTIGNPRTRTKT